MRTGGRSPARCSSPATANRFAGVAALAGFHDDMFPEDTDNGQDWSFLAGLRRAGRSDNWELAAIGGEMVPFQAKRWLGEGYEQSAGMVERGHFTWVGPYCPAPGGVPVPRVPGA